MHSLGDVKFGVDEANKAYDEWCFNCGPAALCAVLDATPKEIRPHLIEFERKGYTNPTLMKRILCTLNVQIKKIYECLGAKDGTLGEIENVPRYGLVRIQWTGPWTNPGVPVRVRYRHTHWIATRVGHLTRGGVQVFDINNLAGMAGWVSLYLWKEYVAPAIIKNLVPGGDGGWWPTHCWEVTVPDSLPWKVEG